MSHDTPESERAALRKEMTPAEILLIPMDSMGNDAGAQCVGGYLLGLLRLLWEQQGNFSGKSPFGNSDWPHELYGALAAAGVIAARQDEFQCWEYDSEAEVKADQLIAGAIDALWPAGGAG
jgi:hypothetical protein